MPDAPGTGRIQEHLQTNREISAHSITSVNMHIYVSHIAWTHIHTVVINDNYCMHGD